MNASHELLLKQHNLSLTAVRVAVLETLEKHPHADATYVFNKVQTKITTASKQAVYNNLNTLVQHGIIREIKPKGHASLYETRIDDNHHHIICRSCQCVIDTSCRTDAPCMSPVDNHGFMLDEAEVIFWGICPDCQAAKTKSKNKTRSAI